MDSTNPFNLNGFDGSLCLIWTKWSAHHHTVALTIVCSISSVHGVNPVNLISSFGSRSLSYTNDMNEDVKWWLKVLILPKGRGRYNGMGLLASSSHRAHFRQDKRNWVLHQEEAQSPKLARLVARNGQGRRGLPARCAKSSVGDMLTVLSGSQLLQGRANDKARISEAAGRFFILIDVLQWTGMGMSASRSLL